VTIPGDWLVVLELKFLELRYKFVFERD